MVSGEKGDGAVDHGDGFGNDAGATTEASEPMAQATVDALDGDGLVFADVMLADGQELVIRAEVIGAIKTHIPGLQPFQQLVQCDRIAIAAFPIDEAFSIAIKSQPDPELVLFF